MSVNFIILLSDPSAEKYVAASNTFGKPPLDNNNTLFFLINWSTDVFLRE